MTPPTGTPTRKVLASKGIDASLVDMRVERKASIQRLTGESFPRVRSASFIRHPERPYHSGIMRSHFSSLTRILSLSLLAGRYTIHQYSPPPTRTHTHTPAEQDRRVETLRKELTDVEERLREANEMELPEEDLRVESESRREDLNALIASFHEANLAGGGRDGGVGSGGANGGGGGGGVGGGGDGGGRRREQGGSSVWKSVAPGGREDRSGLQRAPAEYTGVVATASASSASSSSPSTGKKFERPSERRRRLDQQKREGGGGGYDDYDDSGAGGFGGGGGGGDDPYSSVGANRGRGGGRGGGGRGGRGGGERRYDDYDDEGYNGGGRGGGAGRGPNNSGYNEKYASDRYNY
jgi:hypothetical protein